MGWLPIALALAGFIFFVALVNHNSIIAHKKAIIMAFFQFCQTAKARHALLQAINEIPTGSQCHVHHLEDDFQFQYFSDYVSCIQDEVQSIEDSRLILSRIHTSDTEIQKMLKALQVLNHRQNINIKVFRRKVREYNQLIDTYPTKSIARATGKKSLTL